MSSPDWDRDQLAIGLERQEQAVDRLKAKDPREGLPTFSDSCVHQWEHHPHSFAWECPLCGARIAEMERYETLISEKGVGRHNLGQVVADAWGKAVGYHPEDRIFELYNLTAQSPHIDKRKLLDIARAKLKVRYRDE